MALSNIKRSRALISRYLGKAVTAALDGSLFDHVPATFSFRFADPEKLQEDLGMDYEDYLNEEFPALDDEGEWGEDLIPFAAVSKAAEDDPDDEPYEFAWLFFDWRAGNPPAILVTTTDDWGETRRVESLEALGLAIA
jgi:hypothetical protein